MSCGIIAYLESEFEPQNVFLYTNVAVFSERTIKLNNFNKFPQETHSSVVYPQIFPQVPQLFPANGVDEDMRLMLKTRVRGNYKKVFAGFDHTLLLKLTPPGMKVELLHADPPEKVGGRIRLKVTIFGILRQNWENEFSSYELREDECHFVDTGLTMPFPVRLWRHDHRVLRDGENAIILDDVTFGSGFFLMDWLLYPIMWLQFKYRKPIYQKHFGAV